MTAVSRFIRRLAVGGAAAGIALLAGPGSALASEGYVANAGHAEFDAYAFETNLVVVSEINGRIIFQDQVKIDADDGCTRGASIHLVECNGVFGRPHVYLGNKNDTVRPSAFDPPTVGLYAEGNAGDDELNGGALSDLFYGGWGSDELNGGGGPDTLNADDNAAGDTVDCGSGSDTAVINSGDSVTNCETLVFG
jgi:Ca2+-binding RTX toxin-like protein